MYDVTLKIVKILMNERVKTVLLFLTLIKCSMCIYVIKYDQQSKM
jgi:hypothetical protein